MKKTVAAVLLLAACVLTFVLVLRNRPAPRADLPPDFGRNFVKTDGTRFRVGNRPMRFAGANVAVMYMDDDRSRMPRTLREAAANGARVVRVWAHGEGGRESRVRSLGGDAHNWERNHPFRFGPDRWNEEAFVHLDRVVAEAAKNGLYVQLCLANWWRDTGGVAQYLDWIGQPRAADDKAPYGIDVNRAMDFYSNEKTRAMYKDHAARVVNRRNTVTGRLYRDDPTIFAWELINEGQATTWRWAERRAWVAEMSAFVRSLDPNHMITPGVWGYRNAIERRLWIEDHRLPDVDFAVVHHYPRDDKDAFDESPKALGVFLENRAAAGLEMNKPVVIGEFGMGPEGYRGHTELQWYEAFFDYASRLGMGGAMYWILTPDKERGYGVTYRGSRDEQLLAVIKEGGRKMDGVSGDAPHDVLRNFDRYLSPNEFALKRTAGAPIPRPLVAEGERGRSVYRFAAESVAAARFERLGNGKGYVWGAGVGYFEFVVPEREKSKKPGAIVVRAALKPVSPWDSKGRIVEGDATLVINGVDCGARVITLAPAPGSRESQGHAEWTVKDPELLAQASRGEKLEIRFSVPPRAERPFGINIANASPRGGLKAPVEVEF